jgi:hypothetical protein
VTIQSGPESMTDAPRARSAWAINRVSRARNGAVILVGLLDSAARINIRLVSDFEPGSSTVAASRPGDRGARQPPAEGAVGAGAPAAGALRGSPDVMLTVCR